ncbi:MAG: peptide-methionine (S)-S-oxide reductase MsrA [Myxococcota bacterium]|nr:peptide-methionine (S)-S-oxide reductase MsrA [Myxococcota bacterium]
MGRADPMTLPGRHFVLGTPQAAPFPPEMQMATFAMGCFWGAEKAFWQVPGVYATQAGYTAGMTPHPTYREVCSGKTGHAEAVRIVFDPSKVTYEQLLRVFWEIHDPTQGMRQGNDVGTQYRSGIYVHDEGQRHAAEASRDLYARSLAEAGFGRITTEICPAGEFFLAEDYHQQYLAKNPDGYCGLGGTGVACAVRRGAGSADTKV